MGLSALGRSFEQLLELTGMLQAPSLLKAGVVSAFKGADLWTTYTTDGDINLPSRHREKVKKCIKCK